MKKSNRLFVWILCLLLVLSATCVWAEEAEQANAEVIMVCPCCLEEIELTVEGGNPHELPCSIYAPVDEEGNKIGEDSIHYTCDGLEHSEEVNEYCIDKHYLCQSEYMHTCVIMVEDGDEMEDIGCGDVYPCHESDEHAFCRVCGEPWCLNGNNQHRSRCSNPSHRPCAPGYKKSAHAVCECGEAYECVSGHQDGACKPVVEDDEKSTNTNICPNKPDCGEELMDCGVHCDVHSPGNCYLCGDDNCGKYSCQGNHDNCQLPC